MKQPDQKLTVGWSLSPHHRSASDRPGGDISRSRGADIISASDDVVSILIDLILLTLLTFFFSGEPSPV